MKTHIDPSWMNLELQHKHGGDGWGIIQVLDDDYVRVTIPRGIKENANRAFLAWAKLLKPMLRNQQTDDGSIEAMQQPFGEEDMRHLESSRHDLATGKTKVVSTHIVKA